jgi:hypothetical protein
MSLGFNSEVLVLIKFKIRISRPRQIGVSQFKHHDLTSLFFQLLLLTGGVVVSTLDCHPGDRVSIPRAGNFFTLFFLLSIFFVYKELII